MLKVATKADLFPTAAQEESVRAPIQWHREKADVTVRPWRWLIEQAGINGDSTGAGTMDHCSNHAAETPKGNCADGYILRSAGVPGPACDSKGQNCEEGKVVCSIVRSEDSNRDKPRAFHFGGTCKANHAAATSRRTEDKFCRRSVEVPGPARASKERDREEGVVGREAHVGNRLCHLVSSRGLLDLILCLVKC